ncbi:3-hydroxyacyl-CoA dehydrogenase [Acinetobacter baumannii]|nr:3-hydroxyacyl-CoA dehydrogenase [Acinetobacter baumannii]EKU3011426.1 3-hydroxyacyl-CoA dehydrogenase [Acinetobacter baumannii]EKU3725019.1 3-hydroxyacyl-CoA dehydrogenase [Acinetobacter baumannii]EKU8499087.1 3-hydroxyacyl-CoA dehydrogenase [Acinetobacter baumannii]EKU8557609.1 3-hydroxyacyl-CoA dehydrogenase [Acinetobacter baumannii]
MSIKNVTVLGAGVLGAQIAYRAAYAGFNVISYDINDDALNAAQQRFDSITKVYRDNVSDADDAKLQYTQNRLTLSKDLEQAVSKADLIIEAVPEKLDLKKQVWETVGKAAPNHAIFTTNTSTLLPSEFAEASGDPKRFLALHFANDIWKHRAVEVMGTNETDPAIIDTVYQFAEDMDMLPVKLHKEHAGYIINSLLVPLLDAASHLYADGVAEPQDIDRVWRQATGTPTGPFQIMDTVGLRTVHAIHAAKAEKDNDPIGKKFAELLKQDYLDKGKFGKESHSGFYDYDENGNLIGK